MTGDPDCDVAHKDRGRSELDKYLGVAMVEPQDLCDEVSCAVNLLRGCGAAWLISWLRCLKIGRRTPRTGELTSRKLTRQDAESFWGQLNWLDRQ